MFAYSLRKMPDTQPKQAKATDIASRVIGKFAGRGPGPTLVAVGSIHGNEPAGHEALLRVAKRLRDLEPKMIGTAFLLTGNREALGLGTRFVESDLNRHWTRENIIRNSGRRSMTSAEDAEQAELLEVFRGILANASDDVFILDLHTTSAGGPAFATLGDTLRNRNFARKFPVTIILGIEEQLNGTLLEFLNNEGAITLGFEGGQHADPVSVDNHEALVILSLVHAGILSKVDLPDFSELEARLKRATSKHGFFEVRYRHEVKPGDGFEMLPGYKNFDPIGLGERVATDALGGVLAREAGLIMMPLYQKLGEDGFFIVRHVATFWLWLSALIRRLGLPDHVHLLPGIRRFPIRRERLRVNTRIAKYYPLQFFHLFGFRRLRWKRHYLFVTRRAFDIDSPFGKGGRRRGR